MTSNNLIFKEFSNPYRPERFYFKEGFIINILPYSLIGSSNIFKGLLRSIDGFLPNYKRQYRYRLISPGIILWGKKVMSSSGFHY